MTNKTKLLNIIKDADDNQIAIMTKILKYCTEHPEIYDMTKEQQMQILQSIL